MSKIDRNVYPNIAAYNGEQAPRETGSMSNYRRYALGISVSMMIRKLTSNRQHFISIGRRSAINGRNIDAVFRVEAQCGLRYICLEIA